MLPNNKKSDSWRKTLKLISHCPVCGRDYKSAGHHIDVVPPQGRDARFSNQIEYLEKIGKSDARFIHFTCGYCQSNFMAMVMILSKGTSTVGMVTDLNFKDVQKFHKMPPLTIDETIEAHKMLQSPDFYAKLNI